MRKLDFAKLEKILVQGIKDYFGNKNAIIGLSGGIDSALVAVLLIRALGSKRVLGVLLPYGRQSTKDARLLCNQFGIKYVVKNIFWPVMMFGPFKDKLSKGNTEARARMVFLRKYANEMNGLVAGTTNQSEFMVGYVTKGGDDGVDFEPIEELYKNEVWVLAKYLDIPQSIIDKKPSGNLWVGQTDEEEFGFSYSHLDRYLQGDEIDKSIAIKIAKMVVNSAHKRQLPSIIKIDAAIS